MSNENLFLVLSIGATIILLGAQTYSIAKLESTIRNIKTLNANELESVDSLEAILKDKYRDKRYMIIWLLFISAVTGFLWYK